MNNIFQYIQNSICPTVVNTCSDNSSYVSFLEIYSSILTGICSASLIGGIFVTFKVINNRIVSDNFSYILKNLDNPYHKKNYINLNYRTIPRKRAYSDSSSDEYPDTA